MLDKLLESRANRQRGFAGVLSSVCAHTALIAVALYATAQARSAPKADATTRPVFYSTPKDWSKPEPATTSSQANALRSNAPPIHRFSDVPTIDVRVPSIDMSNLTTSVNDFRSSGIAQGGAGTSLGSGAPSGGPLHADQVERQVETMGGNAPPIYPRVLRETGVEGKVIATFVVGEDGRAEDSTVTFVYSDNPLFDDAVRAALKRMRFRAAEVGGRKVRQLVEMPFVFTLRK
jgi:TonB family protein